MEQKADVFEQVEGPWGCRALVHLLLVLWLMRIYAFENAKSPENQRREIICLQQGSFLRKAGNRDLEQTWRKVSCCDGM